jgi:phenylalanyl-tRNA synthetase alpha chain
MTGAGSLQGEFAKDLSAAASSAALEAVRVKYLGKKGLLKEGLKEISSLSPPERRDLGAALNVLKQHISDEIASKMALLREEELGRKLARESIDVTLPGKCVPYGSRHPVSRTLAEIVGIFTGMGFGVEEGPEVETDYNNFEALNMPRDHPARDMQDTFYITEDSVLRTHTSPVQIRVMQEQKPPLRIIAPGRVYRCDADVSHSPMFHQVEGLMVDTDISFSNLKATLETFIHRFFGPEIPVRFRPGFFPFTEPSAEIDMGCIFCEGRGCRVCKSTGWIEILGAGMVNPKVFRMVGYDPDIYSGFAFGMGIERIAMLKYSIDDIRIFFENDIRFLRQF